MESAADPLALMAGLAGSGLFGDHVVYERPGSWTFAGGTLGEVVLEDGEVRTRWPGAEPVARPWTGRPADALREAFAAAPLPVWNAYGWIAFEFAAERRDDAAAERRDDAAAERTGGRLAHLVVPRVEVRVQDGRAHITGVDGDEIERVAKLLAAGGAAPPAAASPVDVRTGGDAYREKVARPSPTSVPAATRR
ncbi:hypothetical protein [Actinomadura sp. CNU-125]|uniref:hypothetical protein n=1 Tax=Actinomadura sp. CNU-125 TaxID=1904961 RepID=UPI0021CC9598|nr:hypothetical protein [Actinomadura sp. CNU-125]